MYSAIRNAANFQAPKKCLKDFLAVHMWQKEVEQVLHVRLLEADPVTVRDLLEQVEGLKISDYNYSPNIDVCYE